MRSAVALTRVTERCQLLTVRRVIPPMNRRARLTFARGNQSPEPKPPSQDTSNGLQEALSAASSTWAKLDTQQPVYTVVAGAALLVAAPQLLTFVVIALERGLIGALLVVEEVLASVLLLGTRLIVVMGSLALLAVGAYLFLFKKQQAP